MGTRSFGAGSNKLTSGKSHCRRVTSHPPPHSALHLLQFPSVFPWTALRRWHALSRSLVTVWNSRLTLCLPRAFPRNTVCSTPAGILRGLELSLWEVQCGAIRNRMHRQQGNRIQETYPRISRLSLLRRLGS